MGRDCTAGAAPAFALLNLRDGVIRALQSIINAMPAVAEVSAKDGDVKGDVVTNVDRHIQRELAAILPSMWPDSLFVGEEDFAGIPASVDDRPFWIVDPLDGTLNFACGLSFYGMSVALISGGYPVLGVVCDICTGTVYDAIRGHGARKDGRALRWDGQRAMNSPVGISSGFLAFAMPRSGTCLLDGMRELFGDRWRILGSQALQLCLAAGGSLKMNISREAKIWDDAAGYLICEEAGAAYVLMDGGALFPIKPGDSASTGAGLFSIAGSPALVDKAVSFIQAHAEVAKRD